jgi:hypothetical protein
MRIPRRLVCLLVVAPLIGCSTYGFLPETDKLAQPVLNRPAQVDTIKSMQDMAQSHGDAAAKKIEAAR